MKTALTVTANMQTGVGIQAEIKTILVYGMYTIFAGIVLYTQRSVDIENRKYIC